ncbi:MAG: hypothetical protein HFJ24_02895 [Clostridia bacterium]|nr:hypothetical protein [Clostridia bacterium]MCI9274977.1 hypothetical protein [Clostridia bacterium]
MKTVGFIGGYDKLNLVLYIARILALSNKKVLVIDATTLQKTKYVIPTISPTQSYVTEFEGFDVAVGFRSMDMIKDYLGVDKLDYDIALLDVDNQVAASNYDIERNYKNCFVTAFDVYSLKKGVEILNIFQKPVRMVKVLISKNLLKEENEYLDYLTLGAKIAWDKEIISFPIELGNYSVEVINQVISRIKIKKLSDHYKNSLMYLISYIFDEDITSGEIKRIIKNMERD